MFLQNIFCRLFFHFLLIYFWITEILLCFFYELCFCYHCFFIFLIESMPIISSIMKQWFFFFAIGVCFYSSIGKYFLCILKLFSFLFFFLSCPPHIKKKKSGGIILAQIIIPTDLNYWFFFFFTNHNGHPITLTKRDIQILSSTDHASPKERKGKS